uniref:hypothetical protein n=1 Tax=Micrococcus sp. F3Y TaxID=3402627 RepID=UPI003AF42A0C
PAPEPTTTARPEDDDGTYGSIIDFPNFLLHVLKVMSVQDAGLAQAERESAGELRRREGITFCRAPSHCELLQQILVLEPH